VRFSDQLVYQAEQSRRRILRRFSIDKYGFFHVSNLFQTWTRFVSDIERCSNIRTALRFPHAAQPSERRDRT